MARYRTILCLLSENRFQNRTAPTKEAQTMRRRNLALAFSLVLCAMLASHTPVFRDDCKDAPYALKLGVVAPDLEGSPAAQKSVVRVSD